jgi:non-specific protein-tyrosine kinase
MENEQPHLVDYVRPLVAHRWLILGAVLLATVGTFIYFSRKPSVYSASTLVYVNPNPPDPVSGTDAQSPDMDRNVADEATLLVSPDTANAVAKQIRYPGTAGQLLQQVSASSRPGEDFVEIDATGSTGQQAAAIANGFAQTFVNSINGLQAARIGGALNASRSQLARLPITPGTEIARQTLSDQIRQYELDEAVPQQITRQIDAAQAPSSPSSPKPLRNTIFALLISMMLAIGAAFAFERFDRSMRHPEGLAEAYGDVPLLTVLPRVGDVAPVLDGRPALSPELREAFAVLRVNIGLSTPGRTPRTILVSSANAAEGKSIVVRNLALAFRESGQRVAVVDCDLRRTSQGALFGVPDTSGLTEALRSDSSLREVALSVPVTVAGIEELMTMDFERAALRPAGNGNGNGHVQPYGTLDGVATITLVPGGERAVNPSLVLGSPRVQRLLAELAAEHDVVLLDSAPLLDVPDTVPLLSVADAVLLVGRLGRTTREAAQRLADLIDRVPSATVLGVVANDLPQLEAASYRYGYGYAHTASERASRRASPVA